MFWLKISIFKIVVNLWRIFFSLDGYRSPDPELFISHPQLSGKLILMPVKTLLFPANFFFIHFRKKSTEIALRIERTLNNLIVMCRLIMLKQNKKKKVVKLMHYLTRISLYDISMNVLVSRLSLK